MLRRDDLKHVAFELARRCDKLDLTVDEMDVRDFVASELRQLGYGGDLSDDDLDDVERVARALLKSEFGGAS